MYQRCVAEDRIEVIAEPPRTAAPCTMILLDPELEPDPALAVAAARQPAASGPLKNLRIPSTRTLGRFLSKAQAAAGLRGQVTVLLCTDATIRNLNRRFRGKDRATDVLSFPSTNPAPNPEKIAGDLAISVETAREQAVEQGHSLGVELRVLILHGLLHLAGYNHEADAGKMQRREQQLRVRFGLPQGLIERAAPERAKTRRRVR
ncbi:MAG: rRNA maturation RNase YbeY [Terracidiphilus sp.]